MLNLVKQTSARVRPVPPKRTESFKGGKKLQDLFQRLFPRQMSQDYDYQDTEFAIAVAAAAFSIYSLEEAEAQRRIRMREDLEKSRSKIKSEEEGTITGLPRSGRVTGRFSSKEVKKEGETSSRKSTEQDRGAQELSRQPSKRPMIQAAGDRRQYGNSSRRNDVETKADAWERARMEKLNKRYQKVKSAILAWENEKKLQAKLKMERKKNELEQRRTLYQLHYQNKIARIDQIAGGARAQAEEKRRNEESEVKEKAKRIRSTGKKPVKCFCFRC